MISPMVARDLSKLAISGLKESFEKKIEKDVSDLIRRHANCGLFRCEITAEEMEINYDEHLDIFEQVLKAKLEGFIVKRMLRGKWVVWWSNDAPTIAEWGHPPSPKKS
jgi:hypothetical protein